MAADAPRLELPRLDAALDDVAGARAACEQFRKVHARLRSEIARVLVGQDDVVDQVLLALFANGHALLEGVPGLGKTLLIRTLADAMTLPFSRIQFTPDVMPADITGTQVVVDDPVTERRRFEFRRGPIFAQLVLADEINRATPKSQAALLEAMQERSVTIAGTTHELDRPFFVMATQNPIEQEGTYPLPEAQLDRFLLKISVPFTTRDEMNEILRRTTAGGDVQVEPVVDAAWIADAQRLAHRIVIAPHVQAFIVRLVTSTHADRESDSVGAAVAPWLRVGASPRGAQAIVGMARVRALVDGRYAVSYSDVEAVAPPALRHRMVRSFEAEADGVTTDDVVAQLLATLPREAEGAVTGSFEEGKH